MTKHGPMCMACGPKPGPQTHCSINSQNTRYYLLIIWCIPHGNLPYIPIFRPVVARRTRSLVMSSRGCTANHGGLATHFRPDMSELAASVFTEHCKIFCGLFHIALILIKICEPAGRVGGKKWQCAIVAVQHGKTFQQQGFGGLIL